MVALLGTSPGVFIGLTLGVMGFGAYMTGQAVAVTWKPAWQAVLYTLLIGLADRFLTFALFDGRLLLVSGYLIDTAALIVIALVSYRIARVRTMVSQYPWLYERSGPFGWRNRGPEGGAQ